MKQSLKYGIALGILVALGGCGSPEDLAASTAPAVFETMAVEAQAQTSDGTAVSLVVGDFSAAPITVE